MFTRIKTCATVEIRDRCLSEEDEIKQMVPHGGARPGAGRKNADITKQGSVTARLFPPDADTLKGFGDTAKVLTLLAQGLRLGESNLPRLTEEETACLHHLMATAWVDVMMIRHLPDDLEHFDHPGSVSLRRKLVNAGDLELLALVLRHTDLRRLHVAYGSI